jgi:hypothetical protein
LKWLWQAGVAWLVVWHRLVLAYTRVSISLISQHWLSAAVSLLDEHTHSFPINAAANDIDAAAAG